MTLPSNHTTPADQKRICSWHYGTGLLMTLFMTLSAIVFQSTAYAGRGIEPLSSAEAENARSLVLAAIDERQMIAGGARTEFLRAEVFDPGKNRRASGRLARVFVYDYSANQLIVGRVDLAAANVYSLKAMTNKQPPLSRNEINAAREAALSDPDTLARIAAEYQRITGEQFDPDALTIHVRGFNPELARNRTNRRSENCDARRCARLSLVVDDSTLFRFVPIVDLSTGEVIQSIPFGPRNQHARNIRNQAAQNRQRIRRASDRHRQHGNAHQH